MASYVKCSASLAIKEMHIEIPPSKCESEIPPGPLRMAVTKSDTIGERGCGDKRTPSLLVDEHINTLVVEIHWEIPQKVKNSASL